MTQNFSLPPSAATLVQGARDYIEAACKLIDTADVNTAVEPVGLLASHGMELALKAYLLERGMSPGEVREKFGHDLFGLWTEAEARGLPIECDPPYWLQLLNFYYDAPYLYRYPPEGAPAAVIPHVMMLRGALHHVLTVVELLVRKPETP